MHISNFLLVTFFISTARTDKHTCYLPNGKVDTQSLACHPELAESHCCGVQDYCLSNGLCLSNNSVAVGGCTDQNWDHPACFQHCREATSWSRLSPVHNEGNAFCCTAYETVNDSLCTNIYDGSSRPPFINPTIGYVTHHHASEPTSSQKPLYRRQQSSCTENNSSPPDPVIVGVSIGIPLSAALFIIITVCVIQRKKLFQERRRATKVVATNEARRTYVVLPNQRVVMGRGIVRASQSILEGADDSYEIDGRELKRDDWPLPPLPPLMKAQSRRPQRPMTGYRKPSLGGSTIAPVAKEGANTEEHQPFLGTVGQC
ncbi:hypothetical protein EV356DRAFT_580635 [Viridothelium virens]|uniref:Uncharacterized protein n=1 Tax=Viridothelium virens TaxID=1048519 RepID=A0A6A6GVV9_VIRVR|nr:hypothetical protein EV356DRAFT_580635 [Viridothelium virens]